MGKGKGKIVGRVLKMQRGEVLLDGFVANPLKTKKWVGALRLTLPARTRLVYFNRAAERVIKNYYRGRP
jgi:hypothetical protein